MNDSSMSTSASVAAAAGNHQPSFTPPKLSRHPSLSGLKTATTGGRQKRKRILSVPLKKEKQDDSYLTASQSAPVFGRIILGGATVVSAASCGPNGDSSTQNITMTTTRKVSTSTGTNSRKLCPSLVDQPTVKVPPLSPTLYLKRAFQEWDIIIEPSRDQSYFLPVTPERIQAYDRQLLQCIRSEDISSLRTLWKQGQLHINACNAFGESLLHLACRKGMLEVVRFLVCHAKLSCNVHDDYGRTIWHDACWTPSPQFSLVGFLLEQAPHLLTLSDVRGHIAFDYVPKRDWATWIQFLEQHMKILKDSLRAVRRKQESTRTMLLNGIAIATSTTEAQEDNKLQEREDSFSSSSAADPASAAVARAIEKMAAGRDGDGTVTSERPPSNSANQ